MSLSPQRDPHQALKDLAKVCLLTDCTLLLAWRYGLSPCPRVPCCHPSCPQTSPNVPKRPRSAEEAGRYLETFKSYEQKPPDLLKERVEQDFLSRVSVPNCPQLSPSHPQLSPSVP